ncbi:oxidation resistance protein 1 [Saitozyma podzolica]|uniref:Oxidation resistance protein 1 n=1 Tax=Saitozyma podzolica TaxID=1890683 RepID=A0A427YWI5_9TREE|nr:oxidation resistance protein 1 [Saitozyma podzolica]
MSSTAGPSKRRSSASSASDGRVSSEFGAFSSAAVSRKHDGAGLGEHDLLGSFEDLPQQRASSEVQLRPRNDAHFQVDLLGDDFWHDHDRQHTAEGSRGRPPETVHQTEPIHVNLPPRPLEISPDYIPPVRSPRRLSQPYFFAGPSSPPRVTDAGKDIVFHPSVSPSHSPSRGSSWPGRRGQTPEQENSPSKSGSAHSKLLNTLTTTTKLASKWKTVLDPATFHPPHPFPPHSPTPEAERASPTAAPIDITHTTPFATPEQVAGSYIPPTGAPGFNAHSNVEAHAGQSNRDEWPRLSLRGRREVTIPVLTQSQADQLRRHLPPRQRMSGGWTLLFSLDQHGASLSTLYRQVEKSSSRRRGFGNLLVARAFSGMTFGVYMNESIVKREGTFYGSGESFMFKIIPDHPFPRVFKWTGKNQYFALCENSFISFGGGGGAYGLVLDSTFTRNSSATSPAYDNEVLCVAEASLSEKAVGFDCQGLEVWATGEE